MITDKIASKHLGKKSIGSETYDPSLLVVVPRIENRRQYNIDNKNLPFCGYDIWHGYEFSCLTENGIPVTRLLKLKYSCKSEYIIESKSLKLYFNSFNMLKLGSSTKDCLLKCKNIIEKDLKTALKTNVEVSFFDNKTARVEFFDDYKDIMECIDVSSIVTDCYKESPNLLLTEDLGKENVYRLTFDSMRSNCRVTHQPDFGDIFIYYKSQKHIKEESLLKYLVSFRSEYHFHEECCEMVYKRLYDLLNKNDELMVCALYTRRGGIDISPIRYNKGCTNKDFEALTNIATFARYGVKQ